MTLDVHTFRSPIGPLVLGARGDQLVVLHLPGSDDPPPAGTERATPILARTVRQLEQYFAGTRRDFELQLAPEGTEFQRAVWKALLDVPYGATCSYGTIAQAVGRPSASRAVGAANGANPIAIIIPCHRVIGSNQSLTGYGGGLPAKRFLLDLERGGAAQPCLL